MAQLAGTLDSKVNDCNKGLRELMLGLVELKGLANRIDVNRDAYASLLEAIEETRAHTIMVINARSREQMLPHVQRIQRLDAEVDGLLAQLPASVRREALAQLRQALLDYRAQRDPLLAAAQNGALEQQRERSVPLVRAAYASVKQACTALGA